jgi:N-hydroxyarylamine O-acetyltransferase
VPPTGLTNAQRGAYLGRLGFAQRPPTDLGGLRSLQRAHLLAVPFENLDIHLGRAIVLEVDAIVGKVVDARRGGFCYELNSAFAALLVSLGFDVTLIEGRVYQHDKVGIPFDHLTMLVTLGSERFLTDVGFGAFSDEPLNAGVGDDQSDTAGTFRITDRGDGWFDVCEGGSNRYRFSPQPRALPEFADACQYHQTSPKSAFTRNPVCSLRTAEGRVTLAASTLIETVGGSKETSEVTGAELGAVLAGRFGVVLGEADLATLRSSPTVQG